MGGERMSRGVIYIGHLPHGFYEKELRGFFSQFGKVTKLRVCRSKKTGRSKGYGFIEFECEDVAEIAAETMNNYLLFEKLLKCYRISPEKVPVDLFKGFRTNSSLNFLKQRRLHNSKKTSEQDEKRMLKAKKKLEKLKGKLAALGVRYSFKLNKTPKRVSFSKNEENTSDNVEAPVVEIDAPIPSPIVDKTPKKRSPKERGCKRKSLSTVAEQTEKKERGCKRKSLSTVAEQTEKKASPVTVAELTEKKASPVTVAELTEKKASPLIFTPKYKTKENIKSGVCSTSRKATIKALSMRKRSPKERMCKLNRRISLM